MTWSRSSHGGRFARRRWLLPILCLGNGAAIFAAPVTPPASVELTVRGAQKDGRTLALTERLVQAQPERRLKLWWGEQTISARGRDARNRFDASAARYGGHVLIQGDAPAARQIGVGYERLQVGEGRATNDSSAATFVAPRVDTVGVSFREEQGRLAARLRLDHSALRGGTERGTVWSGGAGAQVTLAPQWRFDLDGSLQAQSGPAGRSVRSFVSATLAWVPASWVTLEIGGALAPRGLALAGTPMTGLTSFLLYRPGGAAQSFTDNATGYATLRLVIGRAF